MVEVRGNGRRLLVVDESYGRKREREGERERKKEREMSSGDELNFIQGRDASNNGSVSAANQDDS